MRATGRPAVLPGGGGWLRIMLATAYLLVVVTLWVPDSEGVSRVVKLGVVAVLGFALVVRPGSAAAAMVIFGALAIRVLTGDPVLDGSLIGLIVLLPLVHQLAALGAAVPVPSNVYLTALRPTALRYVGSVLATVLGLVASRALGWW